MDIITRLRNIKPGDRVIYFTGFMAAEPFYKVAELKAAAWKAHTAGQAILTQRLVRQWTDDNGKQFREFEYLAIGIEPDVPVERRKPLRIPVPERSYIQCSLENPE